MWCEGLEHRNSEKRWEKGVGRRATRGGKMGKMLVKAQRVGVVGEQFEEKMGKRLVKAQRLGVIGDQLGENLGERGGESSKIRGWVGEQSRSSGLCDITPMLCCGRLQHRFMVLEETE